MAKEKISIYGLGKLGCTMLACFAHKGWNVIGVDILKKSVNAVNSGLSPIYEPMVGDLIKENKSKISATTNLVDAALKTDISFIIVPTPSMKNGSFTSEYVEVAIKEIGKALRQKKTYHLVVVTSTVMPGETDRMKLLLEKISGKTCGEDFGICYNPDFIALGRIVDDFLNPDMVLIGESDTKAGDLLQSIHTHLVDNTPEFHRMSCNNAELSKIGLNAFCTLKITYANIIGEICENMPGGDANKILDAIGADSRVGKKYFKAGLGFSGPCFPRDNRAFHLSAKKFKVLKTLSHLTDSINEYHKKKRLPNLVEKILKEKRTETIAILGVTYKENVTLIEESPIIDLIDVLSKKNYTIKVYDPAGMAEAKRFFKGRSNVIFFKNKEFCLRHTSVCFVGTPWKEFKDINVADFLNYMGNHPTIIDAWGLYQNLIFLSKIDYRRIGLNK